jgi:hypothetical protein
MEAVAKTVARTLRGGALVSSAGRWPSAAAAGLLAAIAALWRQSLSTLWAALVSRHSDLAAPLPRRRKRSTRRLNLVSANTGSTIVWRLA